MSMLNKDYAIGDYLRNLDSHQRFNYSERERLISIIQDLNKKKEYKHELDSQVEVHLFSLAQGVFQ